jgi:hypothetical protein
MELVAGGVAVLVVLGLVGYLIAVQHQKTGAAEEAANAQADVQTLQRDLNAAKQQNDDLRGRLAATPAAVPTTTSPPTESTTTADPTASPRPSTQRPPGTTVAAYHAGSATMAVGVELDLDALPTDPQWGMLSNGGGDIRYSSTYCSTICREGRGPQLLIVGAGATYDTCATTTGYNGNDIPAAKVQVGLTLCVRTDGGRFSVVTVTGFISMSSPLTISITTYKKTTD